MEDAYFVVHTQDGAGKWHEYSFFTYRMAQAVCRNHRAHGSLSYVQVEIA